jgi:hypothetical protein
VANKGKDNKLRPSTTKASKEYKRQGTKTINANNKGNRTVQQNCMSWSKRIRGRLARTHIKVNTKRADLIPRTSPEINPSAPGNKAKDSGETALAEANSNQ